MVAGTKQEVKISKAVVPKKGLIALSTDDQGFGINGQLYFKCSNKSNNLNHFIPPSVS